LLWLFRLVSCVVFYFASAFVLLCWHVGCRRANPRASARARASLRQRRTPEEGNASRLRRPAKRLPNPQNALERSSSLSKRCLLILSCVVAADLLIPCCVVALVVALILLIPCCVVAACLWLCFVDSSVHSVTGL
jgi:hypothetical protein